VAGGWNKESKGSARRRKSLRFEEGQGRSREDDHAAQLTRTACERGTTTAIRDTEIRIDFGRRKKLLQSLRISSSC
jgi:hypothetical protein